ncbi:MAG TPA: Stp1/IreP family PP2C-type Ser/Thr phosphatase [Ktedonobacterales bacterium]|nr:Stp1/IreP family PP2C-type Ser/Thr phosphatase [Ktedonobacterales bacterium]
MSSKPIRQRARFAERIYRCLLLAHPRAFRESYGQEMIQTFRDCYRDAHEQGGAMGVARLWAGLLHDLAVAGATHRLRALVARFQRLFAPEPQHLRFSGIPAFEVALRTDIGRVRERNEDCGTYVIPEDAETFAGKGALFVIADGMGGHAMGDIASDIAVRTVREAYYQHSEGDIAAALTAAIREAHAAIQRQAPPDVVMGSTCVAAVIQGETAYVANIGDSRAYLVRDGQIRQISRDHSLVAELVRAGLLTEEQARTHEQRNLIYRSLGRAGDVEVDLFTEQVRDGDILVLCSDGLSALVEDDELRAVVETCEPEESVRTLIERANGRGGPDNITAVVARVSRYRSS